MVSCELLARHYYRSEAMAARNHSLQNLKSRNQRVAREISNPDPRFEERLKKSLEICASLRRVRHPEGAAG